MATYWLSYRLDESGDYDLRYKAINSAIETRSTQWWFETTSFILFASDLPIDALAQAVKSAIDTRIDLVVIGMPEVKAMRIIGHYDDRDIESLVPFIKKV